MKNHITDEIVAMCALNRIFGFKPALAHALLRELESASAVFALPGSQLRELLGYGSPYPQQISQQELERTRGELERLADEGCIFIPMGDKDFPPLLAECEDPPVGLYVKSSTPCDELFRSHPMVAMVGTRDISLYGSEWCRRIAFWLAMARRKPCIVSGFALGTDIIAHRSALEAGLPTIAVLPTGIDAVYPSRHRRDAEILASTPGCALVTDYPPHTSPQAINFIRRNRIIAGMSSATILVESKEKGGGMITARLANSYGRDLYALPGRIDDPRSQGCNILMREKLAEPITDEETFLESIGLGRSSRRRNADLKEEVEKRYAGVVAPDELRRLTDVALLIKKCRGITVDELCRELNLPYHEAASLTGVLESDGIITTDLLQRCSIVVKIV